MNDNLSRLITLSGIRIDENSNYSRLEKSFSNLLNGLKGRFSESELTEVTKYVANREYGLALDDTVSIIIGEKRIVTSEIINEIAFIARTMNIGSKQLQSLNEKAPSGWEGTVKKMKKHKEIDNPYALANSMKDKGDHPHYTKDGKKKKKYEEVSEAWGTETDTPEKDKGKWKGWTKERLEKRKSELDKVDDKSADETKELRQINFALRAKNDWGKAD